MGDRTTVQITIHQDYYKELLQKYGDQEKLMKAIGAEEHHQLDDQMTFIASEMNYARWEQCEDILKENNIEFDKSWYAGCEYPAGDAYYRKIRNKWLFWERDDHTILTHSLLNELLKAEDIKKEIKKRMKDYRCPIAKPLKRAPSNLEKFISKKD